MLRFLKRMWRVRRMPRVAAIATMPSRIETFRNVINDLLPQVDMLFVFLDNFNEIPECLLRNDKVQIARSQDVGDFHSAGRFLVLQALKAPSVVIMADDDILYPPNYVSRLVGRLAASPDNTIVGVHGGKFKPPYQSYITDAVRLHYGSRLSRDTFVDELGCGTCAFISEAMTFDVRQWPRHDACDLQMAIEAKRRGLSLVCVRRRKRWLRPSAENQSDSMWAKTLADPSPKSVMMRALMNEAIARDGAVARRDCER